MLFDLSAVTDTLVNLVHKSWNSAPIWTELGGGPSFTPGFSGQAPDAIRDLGGPQLSMWLYHIESDNAHESGYWTPEMLTSPGPPVRYLPFALDLFYLLTAYSENNNTEEQQAMSVALRIFHDNPVMISDASETPAWKLKLTMEHRSYDELSRLWQATTVPVRLGAVYRAAVVFITADELSTSTQNVETVRASINGDIVLRTTPCAP